VDSGIRLILDRPKDAVMPLVRNKQPRYQAYMLRLWETRSECPDRPSTWRFSLEDARTRQKYFFPDLEALVAFLRAQMKRGRDGPPQVLTTEK
jgi:hypothetical protein